MAKTQRLQSMHTGVEFVEPFAPHPGLEEATHPAPNPYRDAPQNVVGKVVGRHSNGTVDVSLGYGGLLTGVVVAAGCLSSDSGEFYIPINDLATTPTSAEGPYEPPTPATGRNIYCLVEFVVNPFSARGNSRMPFVRSFLPAENIGFIGEEGLYFKGHESGIYETIDAQGNRQLGFPDGSWMGFGPSTTQKDMSEVNPNWHPQTSTTPISITLHHSSGMELSLSPTGAISITGASSIALNGTTPVALQGGAVSVDVGGTIYTGTITSGSSTVSAG